MTEPKSLFRREALDALQAGEAPSGPLRVAPAWMSWIYWFLCISTASALIFLFIVWVGDYASGPAVVRVEGRLDLATPTGGIVAKVLVAPGDKVRTGQELVRFYDGAERRDLERAEQDFKLKLARVLLSAQDEQARQSLSSLRTQREQAEATQRERTVRAPVDGVVANVRARQGQTLNAGEVAVSLVEGSQATYSVVALVPGEYRPLLKPGLPMRLELTGYSHVYETLLVESVGSEVLGPSEAKRYLGPELADTVPLQGSLALVRGRLTSDSFDFEGRNHKYYDGIPGTVEVRTRSMRLAVMLFPVVNEILGGEL